MGIPLVGSIAMIAGLYPMQQPGGGSHTWVYDLKQGSILLAIYLIYPQFHLFASPSYETTARTKLWLSREPFNSSVAIWTPVHHQWLLIYSPISSISKSFSFFHGAGEYPKSYHVNHHRHHHKPSIAIINTMINHHIPPFNIMNTIIQHHDQPHSTTINQYKTVDQQRTPAGILSIHSACPDD